MDSARKESLQLTLSVYRLPEDASAQQSLIERAEEDLLSALSLYRRGACGYLPLANICFLLHQAVEKWLKVFIAVQGIPIDAKGQHDLDSRFRAAETQCPEFAEVRQRIENVACEILGHRFPGDLRYSNTRDNIEQCVEVLMEAALRVRRLVKQYLSEPQENSRELS